MSGRAHPSFGTGQGRGGHLEPDLVIEHREALVFLLYQAAEIEHGSMCQYLYAAFTLRRPDDPGLTEGQRAAIERWRSANASTDPPWNSRMTVLCARSPATATATAASGS
ncbi:MAG: hypothetical protein ACRDZW_09450 [Acidimicrobiales bacterium]